MQARVGEKERKKKVMVSDASFGAKQACSFGGMHVALVPCRRCEGELHDHAGRRRGVAALTMLTRTLSARSHHFYCIAER